MRRWLGVLTVMVCALAGVQRGRAQAPYVTLTGTLQGANGLPLSNTVITLQPTQTFYAPGTNSSQQVGNIYENGAPTGPCLVSGQFYTDNLASPKVIYECIFSVWSPITMFANFSFAAITPGTNNLGAMHVGTGSSLDATGSGTVSATAIDGVAVTGTPSAGLVLGATSPTAGGWLSAGGDLNGAYTALKVIGLQGYPLASTVPVASAVPVYNIGASQYDVRQLTQDDIAAGFSITSFGCGACTTVEIGATVSNPAFTASYSSTPATAAITNTDGTSSPTNLTTPFTSATVTGSFVHTTTATTTFTLTAVSTSTKTATRAINWAARTFYGVGTGSGATSATASGNNAVLVGATGTLGTWGLGTNTGTVSVSPSGQHIYFLLSTSGHTFKVNGFTTSFTCSGTTFTNQNSINVGMQLCVSPTSLTGSYSVEVD